MYSFSKSADTCVPDWNLSRGSVSGCCFLTWSVWGFCWGHFAESQLWSSDLQPADGPVGGVGVTAGPFSYCFWPPSPVCPGPLLTRVAGLPASAFLRHPVLAVAALQVTEDPESLFRHCLTSLNACFSCKFSSPHFSTPPLIWFVSFPFNAPKPGVQIFSRFYFMEVASSLGGNLHYMNS